MESGRFREEQELEIEAVDVFGLNVPSQSWRDEIHAAETFWLSPAAIQQSVTTYLTARLGSEVEHLLGEKPLKTLRLNQEARALLLADYRRLPRSIEPIAREWEKWLKGAQPTLSVTFEQETASENPKTVHLSVLHPLGTAGRSLPRYHRAEVLHVDSAKHRDLPPALTISRCTDGPSTGSNPTNRWSLSPPSRGLRRRSWKSCSHADDSGSAPLPDAAECDALDARHHSKWSEAQANHIAENRELAEHRIQSLTVSHRARCKAHRRSGGPRDE